MSFPYAYTSQCAEVTSGTSCTCSINAAAGDWILATVSTRSAATYPSGWTLLHESGTIGNSQKMAFLSYHATQSGTVTFTASQTSSGRIYINLISVSGLTGFEYNSGTENKFTSSKTSQTVTRLDTEHAVIWGCSANIWKTTKPYGIWSCAEISTSPICLDTTNVQARQANFLDDDAGTSRTFVAPASTNMILDYVSVLGLGYVSSGTWELAFTDIHSVTSLADSNISWDETTPTGTTVTVEAKLDGGTYAAVTNGGALPISSGADLSNRTLYIKVSMATQDSSVTPKLENLHIQIGDVSRYKSVDLYFPSGNVNSFQNAVGDITVDYDGEGSLEGSGDAVEAFSEDFTPTGLAPKWNPADNEHLEMSVAASGSLSHVDWHYFQENEHLEMSIAATGVLTHVNDL